jgi:hypothetical protein
MYFASKSVIINPFNYSSGPSKTDSAPVRANAETSHSMRYDLVVVVMSTVGSSEKFSHGIIRSRKPPLSAPYNNSNTILLLRHLYDPTWIYGTQ